MKLSFVVCAAIVAVSSGRRLLPVDTQPAMPAADVAALGLVNSHNALAAAVAPQCADYDAAVAAIAGPLGITTCVKVKPVCGQDFDLTPFAALIPDPATNAGMEILSTVDIKIRADLIKLLDAAKASGTPLQLAPVLELACPKTCEVESVCPAASSTRFLRGY